MPRGQKTEIPIVLDAPTRTILAGWLRRSTGWTGWWFADERGSPAASWRGAGMSVLAVGMSHRTADMRVLERATVASDEVGKVLDELLGCAGVSEAVLVSTCNRVEVYAVVEAFHAGLADVVQVLARHSGVDPAALYEHLYVHYASAAAEHGRLA